MKKKKSEKIAKEFIEDMGKIFWDKINGELERLDTILPSKRDFEPQVLRGLLLLHYRITAIEKKLARRKVKRK